MKGYREAFYPPARSPTPAVGSPSAECQSPRIEQEEAGLGRAKDKEKEKEGVDGVDIELEEMRAMEEMEEMEEMEREAAERRVQENDGPPAREEEDEWEGLYD